LRVFELIEKFNFIYHTTSKLPANKVEKLYQEVASKIEHLIHSEKEGDILRVSLETEFNNLEKKLKLFGLMTMGTLRTEDFETEAQRCFQELNSLKQKKE
jgi:uncharacterized pyridoxal phosphate-containing UPF0001 family protein